MNSVVTPIGPTAVLLGLLAMPLPGSADTETARHMGAQHDAMKAIQAAIIAGSLDAARDPANRLLEQDASVAGEAANADYVEAVRLAASEVLAADTLESAAEAASQLGLACGACHTANSATVEFAEVRRPSDKEKERPHMQRHQWAADRMWEGLIGPDGTAFSRGANLLFESPVKPEVLAKHGGDEVVVGMSRRVHQLAANATTVREPGERAEIFAEFIANCGACHAELAKGPSQ